MKRKLWIAWGVMGGTALLFALLGEKNFAFAAAAVSAAFGWAAFFIND